MATILFISFIGLVIFLAARNFQRVMNGKYKILVSEPFGFVGPAGKNVIVGDIVKVVSPKCFLFQSTDDIEINGEEGANFVLSLRGYEGFSLKNGYYSGHFNVGILLTPDFEDMDEKQLKEHSKFVMIVSLHRNK